MFEGRTLSKETTQETVEKLLAPHFVWLKKNLQEVHI